MDRSTSFTHNPNGANHAKPEKKVIIQRVSLVSYSTLIRNYPYKTYVVPISVNQHLLNLNLQKEYLRTDKPIQAPMEYPTVHQGSRFHSKMGFPSTPNGQSIRLQNGFPLHSKMGFLSTPNGQSIPLQNRFPFDSKMGLLSTPKWVSFPLEKGSRFHSKMGLLSTPNRQSIPVASTAEGGLSSTPKQRECFQPQKLTVSQTHRENDFKRNGSRFHCRRELVIHSKTTGVFSSPKTDSVANPQGQ